MTAAAPVMLFDGHCNLCNHAVDFVLSHETAPELRFASLQSAAGKALLAERGVALPEGDPDTVLLVDGPTVWSHSDAALRVARRLRFPWSVVGWFGWVPRFVRDAVYRLIARNRYRWFGKSETCRVATPAEKARFLSAPGG
jgi:predicted DCC family thiol-disulfide oxidoreductase YuxK